MAHLKNAVCKSDIKMSNIKKITVLGSILTSNLSDSCRNLEVPFPHHPQLEDHLGHQGVISALITFLHLWLCLLRLNHTNLDDSEIWVKCRSKTALQTLFHCGSSSQALISNKRMNCSVFCSHQSPCFELGYCCVPSVCLWAIIHARREAVEFHRNIAKYLYRKLWK